MIPKITKGKTPWKVDPEQLRDLDNLILAVYPNAKLEEGVKYARWATVTEEPKHAFYPAFAPDNVFDGMMFGKKTKILMWLPFFD